MTGEPPDHEPEGRLRPLSSAVLTGWGVVGLASGWLAHPLSERWRGVAPVVTWLPSLLLFFVAAIVAMTAWATRRAMRGERERPAPHQMVNRFVLGRACALVGSLMAGAYAGYAVSWVGVDAELATHRMVRSGVASLGAVALLVAALLLERACRVRSGDDAS